MQRGRKPYQFKTRTGAVLILNRDEFVYCHRMHTFSFTQCACVLFERAPGREELERALQGWPVEGYREPAEGDEGWALCGPACVVELRRGGFAIADLVDRPWPDDPSQAHTPALGAAWTAGAFGPRAEPGALARAADQASRWPEGSRVAERHGGFVRLRTGSTRTEEGRSEGGDPQYDLMMLTELAQSVLRLPGALALFVPAGEALRSKADVEAALARKVGMGPPPFELWSNLRAVSLTEEAGVHWVLLDVVGLGQLGLPDHEAIFAEGKEQPAAVESLLRGACLQLLEGKKVPSLAPDGSGRRWCAAQARSIVAPPRTVLRWLPEESAQPAGATLARLEAMSSATAGTD